MKEQKPYIITIVGPESSGKTTLARQLAVDLGYPWVPEYAREYLERQGGYYDEADLEKIAVGQIEAIHKVIGRVQSAVGGLQLAVGSLQKSIEQKAVLTFLREDFGEEPRPIVIIDSGMMGLRMWAKIKYNMAIPIVEEALQEDLTSIYVLCRPIFPWASDPLREASQLLDRAWIYNHFLKEIILHQSK